jgi:hypothetical protein
MLGTSPPVYPTRVVEMKPLQQSNQDIFVLREHSDKIP